jgi:F-type H+-transporting ATPase subunit epsilon
MFKLSVVTPVKVFYEEEVNSLVAPGQVGYLGVLSNHAPLITALKPGLLTIKDHLDTEIELAISGGFLEVSNNQAMILADAIEYVAEIDIQRAQDAQERAENRVSGTTSDENVDFERSQKALARADNRVNLKKRLPRR